MDTLTSGQPKFDALVEEANALYAQWQGSDERTDVVRSRLAMTLKDLRDSMPKGMRWFEVIDKRCAFKKSWANDMIREAGAGPGARGRKMRTTVGRPSRGGQTRLTRTHEAREAVLREEKERRERANKRSEWLSHELAIAQSVAAGLSSQMDALRAAPVGVAFKGLWDRASEAERAEIRNMVKACR